eukprot:m.163867 g.163867  ORF g.163867 m.163867 type:complete len:614 (+) comp17119_c4_seq1:116-1957(+)
MKRTFDLVSHEKRSIDNMLLHHPSPHTTKQGFNPCSLPHPPVPCTSMAEQEQLNERLLEDGNNGVDDGFRPDVIVNNNRNYGGGFLRSPLMKVLVVCLAVGAVAAVITGVVVSTRSSGNNNNNNGGTSAAASKATYRSLRSILPSMPAASLSDGSEPHLVRATLAFDHTDAASGAVTHFSYDVEHVRSVVSLVRSETFLDAVCIGNRLTLTYTTAQAAQTALASFAVGTYVQLNDCSCGRTVRVVTSACALTGSAGASIMCRTETKAFTQLFKSAAIRFHTNYTEPGAVPKPVVAGTTAGSGAATGATTHTNNGRRRSIGSFLSGALGDIWNAVGGAAGVVQTLVTGSFSYSNNNLLASQWNVPLISGSVDDVLTYSSSLTLTTSSDLEIQIQNYALVLFTATATGAGVVNANANLNAQYNGQWNDGPNQIVQPTTLLSTYLPIAGVDIPVALVGAVWMAASFQTSDQALGAVSYQASGSFTGGITVDSNGPQWVSTPSFTYGLVNQPTLSAAGSAQGAVQVTPSLTLNVGSLGTAQALVPLQFNGNANANAVAVGVPTTGSCPDGSTAFDCNLQIELQASVNIQVEGISVYSQSWGPTTEFSQDYPFANTCF